MSSLPRTVARNYSTFSLPRTVARNSSKFSLPRTVARNSSKLTRYCGQELLNVQLTQDCGQELLKAYLGLWPGTPLWRGRRCRPAGLSPCELPHQMPWSSRCSSYTPNVQYTLYSMYSLYLYSEKKNKSFIFFYFLLVTGKPRDQMIHSHNRFWGLKYF